MPDPYPLRRICEAEFEAWAHVVANTYGDDRSDADMEHDRGLIEYDRTIAAFDEDLPIAGASLMSRTITVPGAVCPVAGVAWVGVSPTHRRRGILTSMMRKQLTELHENQAEPIAALHAAEATIYGRYGYGIATRGAQFCGDKRAMHMRPEVDHGQGTVRLLNRDAALPVLRVVYDQVRERSVGWPYRAEQHWTARLHDDPNRRHGATSFRFAIHQEPDGAPTGYVIYRLRGLGDRDPNNTVLVTEIAAWTPQAYAALWRFLIGIDLHPWITWEAAPDEPLPHMLTDMRATTMNSIDRLWVRLVDVDRALTARRYTIPLDVVLEVTDEFCPWNTGRYRLLADGDSVSCQRTSDSADLRLSAAELGAVYLGGTTLSSLAAAGRVRELRPGTLVACSTAFRGRREPWYPAGGSFPAY